LGVGVSQEVATQNMAARFPFREDKAVAGLSLILKLSGSARSKGELVKLLYLADRATLLKRGSPITGDLFCALPHGMILSKTLNLIDGVLEDQPSDLFEASFEAADHQSIKLKGEASFGALSKLEIAAIEAVFAEHGGKSFGELKKLTHDLPEYEDPEGSRIEVAPETILCFEGRSADEIAQMAGRAQELSDTAATFKKLAMGTGTAERCAPRP